MRKFFSTNFQGQMCRTTGPNDRYKILDWGQMIGTTGPNVNAIYTIYYIYKLIH